MTDTNRFDSFIEADGVDTLSAIFLPIEEANQLLATHYGAEDWTSFEDAHKEYLIADAVSKIMLLIEPTITLDAEFWGQSHVKMAVAIQAWFMATNGPAMAQAIKDGIGQIQSKKLGGISATKFGAGLPRLKQYHPQVLELLRGYFRTSKSIVRA
ncbi:MAG: hypothetical protein H0S80_05070 [Desulfovibrionaceae bacterium]|nr:hypothetical protein [Desulfovibrionaceae bacterium]